MSLKTSFFNKSIFKSDIRRFWWVGVIETILLFITYTLPVWDRCQRAFNSHRIDYNVSSALSWMNGQIIILIIFALCVTTLLLSYMHSTASVAFFHSIPVKRSTIFATKVCSGFLLNIAPVLINFVFLSFISIKSEFAGYIDASALWIWLLSAVIYILVVISLTSAINMMTGHPIGTLVFTLGFSILPLAIVYFAEYFFQQELYGYYSQSVNNFLQYIYIPQSKLFTLSHIFVYPLLTVLFLLLAFCLYKKRKLETNGEVITFGGLKPVFIAIVGLFSSMASYWYFHALLNNTKIWHLIPLGLIGTIIAWMISRKSISFKGILKPVCIYVLSVLMIWTVVRFDLTGYEARVPDIDDIVSVDIKELDVQSSTYIDDIRVYYKEKGSIDTSITDKAVIEDIRLFHTEMINRKGIHKGDAHMPIRYNLKNGKQLTRVYRPDYKEDKELLESILCTPQIKAKSYSIVNGSQKTIKSVAISDRRISDGDVRLYPDNPMMEKLMTALEKDVRNKSYDEMYINNNSSIQISYDYDCELESDIPLSRIEFEHLYAKHEYLTISPSFQETYLILSQLGFIQKIPTAKDLKSAAIKVYRSASPYAEVVSYPDKYTMPADQPPADGIIVTDPAELTLLYNEYDAMISDKKFTDYNNCINVRITYETKQGHTFHVSCSYDENVLPDIFKKYIS